MDKNFIVTELDLDEIGEYLEGILYDFIDTKLGGIASKHTDVSVEYVEYMDDNMRCFKDEFRSELHVEVQFNQYTYNNTKHGEQIESLDTQFEYKGRQPFYIDGKFVSMNVFEWISCCPIQKNEVIYGIGKDKLREMVDELVMTC